MVRCEDAQRRARSHSRRRCGSLGASESSSDDNFQRCDEEGQTFGSEEPQSATRCRSRQSAIGVRRHKSGSTSEWGNRGAAKWGRRAAGSAGAAGEDEALIAESSSAIFIRRIENLQRQRVSPRRPDRAVAIGRRHRPDNRQDSAHTRRHSSRADRARARRRDHDNHSRRVHAGCPALLPQRSLLAGVLRHQQGDRAGAASGAGGVASELTSR